MQSLTAQTLLGLSILAVAAGSANAADPKSETLTPAENKSTAVSREWQDRPDVLTVGADGTVVFLFGFSQPTVVCTPLRLCDLQLQPGETVLNVHAGDSVRWKFDGARSGPSGTTPHVLIKPVEKGLETSLVITTDRRTYHLHLKSTSRRYMARMAFDYSEEANSVLADLSRTEARTPIADPEPAIGTADNLDFDYSVRGEAHFKPVRVYNDGIKTYVEMPSSVSNDEAPILLVVGPGKTEQLVNYRLKGSRLVVDQLFDKAILIAGVGRHQSKVTISRSGLDHSFLPATDVPAASRVSG